jgi:2-methylisocitrate lyase-like PEP mutase family enzyme
MIPTQPERYERFRSLHEGDGFIMPNAWDGLSARMFAQADFAATATSSAALAFSLGRRDGRHEVNRDEHLAHARLLSSASGLPVNGDFEDGYGATPEDVADTVCGAIPAPADRTAGSARGARKPHDQP